MVRRIPADWAWCYPAVREFGSERLTRDEISFKDVGSLSKARNPARVMFVLLLLPKHSASIDYEYEHRCTEHEHEGCESLEDFETSPLRACPSLDPVLASALQTHLFRLPLRSVVGLSPTDPVLAS